MSNVSNVLLIKYFNKWVSGIRHLRATNLIVIALSLLLASAVFLVCFYIYTSYSANKFVATSSSVQHKLNIANDTFSTLKDADIFLDDYILTGNLGSLSQYQITIPRLNAELRQLKSLDNDTTLPSSSLVTFASIVQDKESGLQRTLTLYKQKGTSAAIATIGPHSEHPLQSIEELSLSMRGAQDKLLADYLSKQHSYQLITNVVAPLVLLTDFLLVFLTLYMMRSSMHKERRLELARNEFISIASHQLRTPATVIKQYTYMLLDNLYGKLSKKQKAALSIINEANNRSIRIVNNLLYVTQIDTGQLHLKERQCSLSSIIQASVDNYKTTIQAKNLRLINETNAKRYILRADEKYLQLVFENILDNACRYTPPGKSVTVAITEDQETYTVRFRDEGIGISDKEKLKLFKKFARLKNGVTLHPDGSGLGLYIAQEIITLHDGDIDMLSSPHNGTTVSVTLPKEK